MANPFRQVKHLVFQKGGIGRSLSREDTVRRLNPLMQAHVTLNLYHNYVVQHHPEPDVASGLAALQKTARADTGKLAETIYSAGGVAYTGVDLEPEEHALSEDTDAMLFELFDHEDAFYHRVRDEFELEPREHQLRTKAILENLLTHSQARLNFLKENTKRRRRPAVSEE